MVLSKVRAELLARQRPEAHRPVSVPLAVVGGAGCLASSLGVGTGPQAEPCCFGATCGPNDEIVSPGMIWCFEHRPARCNGRTSP
jgi:hypothetical protein